MVVLASGGIEKARLLLLSNSVQTGGLRKGKDLVGRYYMDHPRIQFARLLIPDARRYRPLYDATLHRIQRGRGANSAGLEAHLAPVPDAQRRLKLLNSRTYLVARLGNDVSESYIALKSLQKAFNGRRQFGYPFSKFSRDVLRQLGILFTHAPKTAITVMEVLLNPLIERRLFALETVLEPVPNPNSRVFLAPEREQLGSNQVQIDWRLTEQDTEHFAALKKLIIASLSQSGVASVLEPLLEQEGLWPGNVGGAMRETG